MIGIDLVQISEFKDRMNHEVVLNKVFTAQELKDNLNVESLAGIFAAKEAFLKALGKKKCNLLIQLI